MPDLHPIPFVVIAFTPWPLRQAWPSGQDVPAINVDALTLLKYGARIIPYLNK